MDAKTRLMCDVLRAHLDELPEVYRNEIRARLIERGQPHAMWPGVMNEVVWDNAVVELGAEVATRIVIGICEEPLDEHL